MKTLELKDIAAYLPYGSVFQDKGFGLFHTLANLLSAQRLIEKSRENPAVRPILRPMSDLTKEITHKGEIFIPIVRLFSIQAGLYLGKNQNAACKLSYLNSEDPASHGEDWYSSCVYDDMKLEVDSDGVPALFQLSHAGEWLSYFNHVSYKHYEIISEWMFDYRGLIPAGLAVDVNTLDKNPYEV